MKKKHPPLSIEALAVILLVLVSAGLTWAGTIANSTSSTLTWPGLTSGNVTAPTFNVFDTIIQPLITGTGNTTSVGNVIIPPATTDIWDTTGSTESATGCCSKRVVNGKTSGICVKGTGCSTENRCSNIGGSCVYHPASGSSGGSGGSGGGTTPSTPQPTPSTPQPNQPTHWVCNTNKECVEVNGSGVNQCKTHSECGGESPGGGGDIIPWEERTEHWECVGTKCTMLKGPGQDSCYSNSQCGGSNAPQGFWARVWSTILSWFGY